MGIRQLPSGSFQVRFRHHGTAYAATFASLEVAIDAVLAGFEQDARVADEWLSRPQRSADR